MPPATVTCIPQHLWIKIVEFLPAVAVLQLRATCSFFYHLTQLDSLWATLLQKECIHWNYLHNRCHSLAKAPHSSFHFHLFWSLKPKSNVEIHFPFRIPALSFFHLIMEDEHPLYYLLSPAVLHSGREEDTIHQIPVLEMFEIYIGFVDDIRLSLVQENHLDASWESHHGCLLVLQNDQFTAKVKTSALNCLKKLSSIYEQNAELLSAFVLVVVVVRHSPVDGSAHVMNIVRLAHELELFQQPYRWNIFYVDFIMNNNLNDWTILKHWICSQLGLF